MPSTHHLLTLLFLLLFLLFLRLLTTLPRTSSRRPLPRHRGTPTRLLIILGSGGHTAEMLLILRHLSTYSYTHRSYIVSSGDDFSAQRAVEFEAGLKMKAQATVELEKPTTGKGRARERVKGNDHYGSYDIAHLPRARQIHQPLLSTPLSALHTLLAAIPLLLRPAPGTTSGFNSGLRYPDLIVTNGPATGAVVVAAAVGLRFFGVGRGAMRCVFVESWARVRGLSLSGRVLRAGGLVERVVVQWRGVEGGEWGGCLVG